MELLQSNELIVLANSSKKECSSHDMHKFIARVESLLVRINLGASFTYCFRTKVFSSDAAQQANTPGQKRLFQVALGCCSHTILAS